MSQWRKVAIEHVPSCKRVIEESSNPVEMWRYLYYEISTPLSDEEKSNFPKKEQVCNFALFCLRCNSYPALSDNVFAFFELLLNLKEEEELYQYYPMSEIKIIRKYFPPDLNW